MIGIHEMKKLSMTVLLVLLALGSSYEAPDAEAKAFKKRSKLARTKAVRTVAYAAANLVARSGTVGSNSSGVFLGGKKDKTHKTHITSTRSRTRYRVTQHRETGEVRVSIDGRKSKRVGKVKNGTFVPRKKYR
jgi:hypothetical protein